MSKSPYANPLVGIHGISLDIRFYDEIRPSIQSKVFTEIMLFIQKTLRNRIGCCPKCKKFFYRKRKDQVYCSDNCKYAAASQKQRDKKKRELERK